jgi:hypothetical protein
MGIFKNILGTEKIVDSVGGIIDGLVTNKEEKINARAKLKEVINNYKIEVEKNVSERWKADMNSDSWLSKNVRPVVLVFLIVCTMLLVFIDSGSIKFNVKPEFVSLLTTTLITVIGAYFGGRSVEKLKKK